VALEENVRSLNYAAAMIDPADALRMKVERALAEDLGAGDVTSEATVPAEARARARIVQKEPGVVYGLDVVAETMRQCGVEDVDNLVVEGQWREHVPAEVVFASGSARSLLAAERTALNFLGHLSGIATMTARYVEAVAGTGATILDTRKTMPALRWLEKAAVAAGGGLNHRMGLYDAVLIKENHIALGGGLARAVYAARTAQPELAVEVEVRDPDEAAYALGTGADRLLLDNMTPDEMRTVVALRDEQAGDDGQGASLEASGGVTLDNVGEIAETGVDFISIGALTHSSPSLDFSMLLEVA
jgi:nicotinate-nucleotide pyrophosphorylase (carboxylating)